jgi:hypothetical protein
MGDNQPIINGVCRHCGCNQAQAAAGARALGFEEEFASGIYTCCQVVQWAGEQRLAWLNAAGQDEPAREFVYVRSRKPQGL